MIGFVLALITAITPAGVQDLDHAVADRAYDTGRFEEAMGLYRVILSEPGLAKGPVLFNLGNCAFRLGRHPEALLYYRRAQLRMPHDREVAFNLRMAQRQLGVEPREVWSLSGMISAFFGWFTTGQLLLLVTVLQLVGVGCVALRRRRRDVFRVLLLLLLCSSVGAGILIQRQWFPDPPAGIVLADEISLRSEPHFFFSPTLRLRAGETLRIEEFSDRWARVTHTEGSGWTPRDGVGVVQ